MRMEIEEADDQEELMAIQMQVDSEYDNKVRLIGSLFEQQKYDEVRHWLNQTKYLEQMMSDIDAKRDSLR